MGGGRGEDAVYWVETEWAEADLLWGLLGDRVGGLLGFLLLLELDHYGRIRFLYNSASW